MTTKTTEIEGIPVEEIAPGVYEGALQDADGLTETVVFCDSSRIATYNGIPLTDDE